MVQLRLSEMTVAEWEEDDGGIQDSYSRSKNAKKMKILGIV